MKPKVSILEQPTPQVHASESRLMRSRRRRRRRRIGTLPESSALGGSRTRRRRASFRTSRSRSTCAR
eukprot:6809163-Prymnesium_polylepis.1